MTPGEDTGGLPVSSKEEKVTKPSQAVVGKARGFHQVP